MGRRVAREQALKALYQIDVANIGPREALENVLQSIELKMTEEEFARDLVWGTWQNRQEIDQLIARFSIDWSLERLSRVERAILRIAVYEMLRREDIPSGVSINEAVELAKKYSGTEAGRFVNGILRGIDRGLEGSGQGG